MTKYAPIKYQVGSQISAINFTLKNFKLGDTLIFSSGISVSVENTASSDGAVDLVGTFNGQKGTIRIPVTAAQDKQITDVDTFNQVFGAGSLSFDPLIKSAVINGRQVSLTGNAGPGVDKIAIYRSDNNQPLGEADVQQGQWTFQTGDFDNGTYDLTVKSLFLDGTTGASSLTQTVKIGPTYQLAANANSVKEGDNVVLDLKTINVPDGTVLGYTLSGSGIGFSDFSSNVDSALKGNVTVSNNQAQINIGIANDKITEGDETFVLSLDEKNLDDQVVSSEIKILDVVPVTLTTNTSNVFEEPGKPNTVTYQVTGQPGTQVSVSIDPSSVAQAADIVSTSLPDNNVLTLDDKGQASFTVTAKQDESKEGNELFRVTATQVGNTSNTASSDVTIQDIASVKLTANVTSLFEEPGIPNTVTYQVTGQPGTQVSVSIDPSSVAQAADIVSASLPNNNVLTLDDKGQASFTVTAKQDESKEGNELFRVTATQVGNTSNTASSDVTIQDVPAITLDATPSSAAEGNSFSYQVSGPANATVNLAIAANSTAQAADISGLPSSVTLDSTGKANFTVTALNDILTESDEALRITATQAGNASNTASSSVTIQDVAVPLTLSATPSSAAEGNSFSYQVSGPANATVNLAIAANSTAQAADISGLPSSVTLDSTGKANFTVTALNDILTESDEALRITATQAGNASNTASSSVTIQDVAVPLTLSATPSSAAEGNSFSYQVSGPANATVNLAIAANSTAQAADISGLPSSVTLDSTGKANFTVTALNDILTESDEALRITATQAGNASNTASSSVTIQDVAVPLTLSATPSSAAEGNSFSYQVSGPANATVNLAIAANSTAQAADISGLPSSVTLDSTGKANFTVTALNDILTESDEALRITATQAGNASNTASSSVTIQDVAVPLTLSATPSSAAEGNSFSYQVSGPANATVNLAIAANSTAQAADISGLPSSVTLDSTGKANFTVTALNDILTESDEALRITATQAGNASNTASSSVTIQDVAVPLTLSATPSSAAEGNSFSYQVSGPANATVNLAIAANSTAQAADISGLPSSVTLDSTGKANFTVTALNDILTESDEALRITATQAGNASNTASSSVTIQDVAVPLTLSATPSSATEGNSFSYQVSGPANATVNLAIDANSTAQAADISGLPSSVTLDSTGKANFTVTALNDIVTESDEALRITATQAGNASNTASSSVTIQDVAVPLTLTATPSSVIEGNAISYQLSGPAGATVSIAIDPNSVAQATDVSGLPSSVTLDTAGKANFTVTALNDILTESDEALRITATQAGNASNTASSSVTIQDVAVPLTLTATPSSVVEGNAISYQLSGPAGATISIAIDPNSVAQAADVSGLPSSVTLDTAGKANFTVTALTDTFTENSEAFQITASQIGNASNSSSSSVTIQDAVVPLTLSATPSSVVEGNAISYQLSGPAGATISIAIDPNSPAQAADVSGLPSSVTLDTAGKASFTVTALNDLLTENSEAFQITASQVGNASNSSSSSVTIQDAVVPLVLSATPSSVVEGNSISYQLSGPAGATISIAIDPNSVAQSADVSGLPSSVTLDTAGKANFTVTALTDTLTENSEAFQITASQVGNASNNSSSSVTIQDAVVPLVLSATPSSVVEGNAISYQLSGPAGATISIAIDPNSMAQAADVSGLPSSITLDTAGKANFTVTALDDKLTENSEAFQINASQVGNASNSSSSSVTIQDAVVPLTLSATPSSVVEGNAISYQLSGPAGATISIAIDPNSVAQAADVSGLPSSVTLDTAGKANFTVTALTDTFTENSEAFQITASQVGNASNSSSSSVTIQDAVVPLTLSATPSSVVEGNAISYQLSGPAGATISIAIDPNSVAQAADVSRLPSSVTLDTAGKASFTVTALNDTLTENSELLQINASQADNLSNTISASVTIQDPTLLALTANPSGVFEGDSVSYQLSGPVGATIDLAIDPNSTAQASDIIGLPNSVLLDVEGFASFSITAKQDNVLEMSEQLRITATQNNNPGNVASTDVTIWDPLLTPDVSSINELPGPLPNSVTYTVIVPANSELTFTQNYVANGADPYSDYTTQIVDTSKFGGQISQTDRGNIAINNLGKPDGIITLSFTAQPDFLLEGDEWISIKAGFTSLGIPYIYEAPLVTIKDTPTQLTLTTDKQLVFEGNSFVYQLTGPANTAVDLTIDPNSVAQAADISGLPSSIILDDTGHASITVTALSDRLAENSELLSVTATQASNSSNTISTSVTIQDVVVPLALTATPTSVFEGDGISYQLTGPAGATVSVAIDPNSPAQSADVSGLPSSVILDSAGNASFTITALPDTLVENSELFRLVATQVDNGSNTSSTDVTINDVPSALTLTLSDDVLTGTSGNDVFSGPLVDGVPTLSSNDIVKGDLGFDTLTTTLLPLGIDATTGSLGSYSPVLVNVERLNIELAPDPSGTTNTNVIFDGSNSSGLTEINVTNPSNSSSYVSVQGFDELSLNNLSFSGDSSTRLQLLPNANYHPFNSQIKGFTIFDIDIRSSGSTIDLSNQTIVFNFHNGGDRNTLIGGNNTDYFYNSGTSTSIAGGTGYDYYVATTGTTDQLSSDQSLTGVESIFINSPHEHKAIDLSNQSEAFDIEFIGLHGNSIILGNSSYNIRITNNIDTVTSITANTANNFQPNNDRIYLDSASGSYSSLPKVLTQANFLATRSPVASTPDQFLLYDTATGLLSYDADGSGPTAAIGILQLTGIPSLSLSDLSVF